MDLTQQVAGFLNAYAYEDIVVDNTVKKLTLTKLKPSSTAQDRDEGHARLVLITNDGGSVRVTYDGTTPVSATTGHLYADGSAISLGNFQAALNFQFTRDGGTNSNFRVTYFR